MNNIFYNIQRGFLKLYFSMNADKIADLERKIRKGPLPSTVNTINWLFSNQEFSIKPKQYHLSILTTHHGRAPAPSGYRLSRDDELKNVVTLEARLDTCREDKRLLRGKLKNTGTDTHSDNGDIVTVCVQTRPPGTTAGWRGS